MSTANGISAHVQLSTRRLRLGYTLISLLPTALLAGDAEEPAISYGPRSATALSVAASSSAMIGSINIVNNSIFDLSNPEENKALYRLANRVHVTTRPDVIRQQLLFEPGDSLSTRELEESERILRSNRYIQNANIERVPNENGEVDINVQTTDVWTLVPKVSLSRSGGENNSGIGLKEMNLLGTGIDVEALYKSDVDRESTVIRFLDRNLGSSWYSLGATYANNSDGHTYLLDLGKPFYSLDSKSSVGVSFLDSEQIDSLYESGEIQAQYEHQATRYELFKGWSRGLSQGWTKRYTAGLAYDNHRFGEVDSDTAPASFVPEDRKLVYPFVGVEFVQDRYEKAENYDQVNRTEDRYLGTRFGARLGMASASFGSDRDAWIVSAGLQTGFGKSEKRSVILASNLATRVEDGGLQNAMLGLSAKYYSRQSERRLFYASLSGTFGTNLDIDNPILLGGDSGLRGYPLRYQTGDKSALLTLEQRYFTDWYPWRLFRIGGAIFFDAGKAFGNSPVSDGNNELLKDIGFGLRIGNPRSGHSRMTHIDLAFPLDGGQDIKSAQLLIETKKSF